MSQKKVLFRLEKDDDGYPPADVEGVWCVQLPDDGFVVDNIPFFARQVALGDVVSVEQASGELFYTSILQRSTNSLLRVVLFGNHDPSHLRSELAKLGCATEQSHLQSLIAVNIPSKVKIGRVRQVLDEGCSQGLWDYEETVLRQ
ncbi:MAG TPA: DUF4265 domain-containing protein [Tepidisphaeraceae bacterium]|nr:DUF4265 domain-containing protein [Tepidisphaeraceae bacterium]